jgi:8-oxo-dGTP pyrophosphatase MutT (NUDIX family)
VKAIVVRDGALLVLRCRDADGDYFILPGGGQEPGETLHEALRRECREEVGAEIDIGELRFVRDYIGAHHEFAETDTGHQVELMFDCSLASEPGEPSLPDTGQTGIAWLGVADLQTERLYPKVLRSLLETERGAQPVYLGDCN